MYIITLIEEMRSIGIKDSDIESHIRQTTGEPTLRIERAVEVADKLLLDVCPKV